MYSYIILNILPTFTFYIEFLNIFEADFHIWCDVKSTFILSSPFKERLICPLDSLDFFVENKLNRDIQVLFIFLISFHHYIYIYINLYNMIYIYIML